MHSSEVIGSQSKAYWIQTTHSGELVESTIEQPRSDSEQVAIKALFSGVSPGTERLVASGHVPEECHTKMQCQYMEGQFGFPLKYGYSMVGQVLEGELSGNTVYLMHPHQDYFYADPSALTPLPSHLNPRTATLLANAETALNAVWDSRVFAGEKVVIVGAGIVGMMVALILKNTAGVDVTVVEKDEKKCQILESLDLGIKTIQVDSESKNYFPESDFDLAFHTSASGPGLQFAVDSVGLDGRIVELSWYGDKKISLDLGGSFHFGRKTIISSQVSQIAIPARARWSYHRRLQAALKILELKNVEKLMTHTSKFSEMPEMMSKIYQNSICSLSVVIEY